MSKPDFRVIFRDIRNATKRDIADREAALIVTSPPYFNAPFDYPGLFKDYQEYLALIRSFAALSKRALADGRVAAIVTDDMLVPSRDNRTRKYPIVADTTRIFLEEGFRYRDKIVWVKPRGYARISRRSGVLVKNPYPMYYYPDNIQESILIFQKGRYDYTSRESLSLRVVEASRIDAREFNRSDMSCTVWNITNVLPRTGRPEEGIAAFPEEIPQRLIKLFTYTGEIVLDAFLGSGTTLKAAKDLGRRGIGIEIDLELEPVIRSKLGWVNDSKAFRVYRRSDALRLRGRLRNEVARQRSVARARTSKLG